MHITNRCRFNILMLIFIYVLVRRIKIWVRTRLSCFYGWSITQLEYWYSQKLENLVEKIKWQYQHSNRQELWKTMRNSIFITTTQSYYDMLMVVTFVDYDTYLRRRFKIHLNSIKLKSKLSIFKPQGLRRRTQLSVNFGNNRETLIKSFGHGDVSRW